MTLLDEYRRAVYSANEDERRRRLTPLVGSGSRLFVPGASGSLSESNVAGGKNASNHQCGTSSGKRRKAPLSSIRLETLCLQENATSSNGTSAEPQTESGGGATSKSVCRKGSTSTNKAARHGSGVVVSNQQETMFPIIATGTGTSGAQLLTQVAPAQTPERKPSILDRLAVLSAAADKQRGSHTFCTPRELPSQFIHGMAHINVSRWTTIVSDVTLHRIGARNRRIHNTVKQRLVVHHGQLGTTSRNSRSSNSSSTMSGRRSGTAGAALVESALSLDKTNSADDTVLTRSIVINGADQITDAGLRSIADNVPTLETLEIASASQVTDAGLRALAAKCPSLQRLNLSQCYGIQGAGLGAIAELCTRVCDLQIADCSQLGDWVLLRCFYSFSQTLEHVNVSRCAQITDTLLKALATQCPHLRSIHLGDCSQVSDVGVVQLAQKCPLLEKITLNRSQYSERLTDTCCAALGEHCPSLQEVCLSGCNFVTDAGVKWIADGCPQLESLDLTNVFYATDASMRALSGSCPQLKTLKLSNVKNVSDVGLRFLATGCPLLESLHVGNLYLVSDGAKRDFGLEGLQAIAKGCSHLKELNLGGCFQLVERALVALGNSCHRLTRINLKACPKITLLAVNALLHGCPSLVSLNLSGVQLCNNAMLAAIGVHGVALKELCVAQCDKISDAGLRHLASRADQFETLDFSGCVLITDAGLTALLDGFQRPMLAHLFLAGCSQITQDPIARLAFACPLLLTLSVHGCRVSARVLQSLSSSWPFGTLRVPTGAAATSSHAEFGIFPVFRAKDRRFVESTCVLWVAAVKVQNLFRRRLARRQALLQLEQARREFVARRLQSVWRGRKSRRETLLRKLLRSGREKSAIKIQRQYRALRQSRKTTTLLQSVFEQQTEKYAILVQRGFRAKRAAHLANTILAARRKEHRLEVAAATLLQRRYRGIAARKRVSLLQLQKQAREHEQQEASLRIQAIYRGRMDRKRAKQAERETQLEQQRRHASALKIQSQFRRRVASTEAKRRRAFLQFRERCAVKLQTAFRARKARNTTDLLRLARYHAERDRAALFIQRHWRGRVDRMGFAVLAEAKRHRLERELRAAIHLQRTFRRYAMRKRARGVMQELLALKQRDDEMEIWAATLVQSHWRRRKALAELARVQADKRSRWKQLVDTHNQHGMGFGAPFFYNQVNGEIRWRMPREILMLQPRPGCDQCDGPACANIECATCCEFFCDACHRIVHGRGKRRVHATRKLFNFYGIRCDHGDGEFPSIWPSDMLQDRECGYDFATHQPKENYQEMLWRIAKFVPVETDPRRIERAIPPSAVPCDLTSTEQDETTAATQDTEQRPHETASIDASTLQSAVLFLESDLDDTGNSLWESFFDYASQEYRYYHRISKRVTSYPPRGTALDDMGDGAGSIVSGTW